MADRTVFPMRILHTSDWHIGRTFHGADLLDDQRASLRHLADVVAAESVDVVVVAGDVFDRSVPSADAVRVYDDGLAAIASAGAAIVVTSGNHDSPTRLGVGSGFAAAGGLHLRTSVASINDPIVFSDEHGDVAIYGIPYLEPEVTRTELGVEDARGHSDVLTASMERIRADLAARDARSVVVAHAFVVGGLATGSERSISVGGVETVAAEVFSGVDYVALGHLHSPQELTPTVRYSGSPIPYSFGENTHHKAVWLVDLGAVDERVVVAELDLVTGHADDALDVVLVVGDVGAGLVGLGRHLRRARRHTLLARRRPLVCRVMEIDIEFTLVRRRCIHANLALDACAGLNFDGCLEQKDGLLPVRGLAKRRRRK